MYYTRKRDSILLTCFENAQPASKSREVLAIDIHIGFIWEVVEKVLPSQPFSIVLVFEAKHIGVENFSEINVTCLLNTRTQDE